MFVDPCRPRRYALRFAPCAGQPTAVSDRSELVNGGVGGGGDHALFDIHKEEEKTVPFVWSSRRPPCLALSLCVLISPLPVDYHYRADNWLSYSLSACQVFCSPVKYHNGGCFRTPNRCVRFAGGRKNAAQQVPNRVPLAGDELKAFRDEENRKRRLELEEEEQRRHAAAMEKEQVRREADARAAPNNRLGVLRRYVYIYIYHPVGLCAQVTHFLLGMHF